VEQAEQNAAVSTATIESLWVWAKRQAISKMDLSWGAKEAWRILEAFPANHCFPSHWYIAERLLKSRSAVRRYLRELEEKGYIATTPRHDEMKASKSSKHRTPRGQTSNAYTILDQPDLIARARQILEDWHAKHHNQRE